MIDDIMKVKAIKAFLNTHYSSVLGWSLDANNFLVDQDTFKFLRQALRYEVGMSLDTPDSNPTFKNKLDNVGEKLNNGWTSNVINLLKITLVLKNIAPNLDYESSVYGESFGLALYQFQTDAGILDVVGDQSFKSYEIIALFSDYGFKPVLATDAKARELGQYLNSYVIKHGIASIVGLTRTDGLVYNFGDYSPLIVAQLQRENQLTVTGKLTEQNCPAYDETKDSIVYPVAETLYLRGYLDNIPQDYFDSEKYHYAIGFFQGQNNYQVDWSVLTSGEMIALLNGYSIQTVNALNVKQTHQAYFSKLFKLPNLQVEWNNEIDLGFITIASPTGVLDLHVSAEIDYDTKIKNQTGFNNDHTMYTVDITNGQFHDVNLSTDLENITSKLLLDPVKGPIAKTKLKEGAVSITIDDDSLWTNSFTITYAYEITGFKSKHCSISSTVKIKLQGKYSQLINILIDNAQDDAKPVYQNIKNGNYLPNIDPKYGIDAVNKSLNLYLFTQLKPLFNTNNTITFPNGNASNETMHDVLLAGFGAIFAGLAAAGTRALATGGASFVASL